MKELILIEGLSKDELFTAIQAVVKDLLFFEKVFENETTVTSLKVMEGDRINQYVVRPNRLCNSWDFHSLCNLFKSELSSHKGVVAKAWFQLPDDETMSILPRGKYYYDLSDSSTDEIFAVATSGTRYGFVEIDDEGGAELMEIEPQGRSTYEPRPMLQLRPMADGFFEVEKLTFWQRIKKRYAGFMGSHSSLGVGLWSILFIVVLVVSIIFLILIKTGIWEEMNSVEKMRNLILGLGFWGRSCFVLFQFLQVTFIPIPSPILVITGSLIYGPLEASILSLAGILLGSAVAFFIGKVFGIKIVRFMVGKQSQEKWTKFLSNYKYSFILMMLLPLFPDDLLCLVAGLTDMSWTFFMTTQFITRPIGITLVSYFSSGQIIPYHGWGLFVWGVIAIFSVIAIYLSSKYNKQIESYIKKVFKKK